MGKSTVAEFRRQRQLLENAQSRLIDAGHTMGLSQSLMSVIQRRDFVDRLITFGGMFIVLIVVLLIWWFKG
jgi:Golgi SNAP receptor complex protein 2